MKRSEGKWHSLPVLLLWSIKDRLDFFDDLCSAAVCSDWRLASSTYPNKKHSVGDGIPWIMKDKNNHWSHETEFMSVTSNKKFTVDMPEFRDGSRVACSKHGWILMRRRDSGHTYFILVNPLTRATIRMPSLNQIHDGEVSFSTTNNGYPHCVVVLVKDLVKVQFTRTITLAISYVGDEGWTEHSYLFQEQIHALDEDDEGDEEERIHNRLLIIGQVVYCFVNFYIGGRGGMLLFNIATKMWEKTVSTSSSSDEDEDFYSVVTSPGDFYSVWNVAEWEGGLVRVKVEDSSVFRFNYAESLWEKRLKIDDDDVKDTHWFFDSVHERHKPLQICFSARKQGSKAYILVNNVLEYPLSDYRVIVFDFESREGKESVGDHSDSDSLGMTREWVNIG